MYYKYTRDKSLNLKIENELLYKIKQLANQEKLTTSEYVRRKLKMVVDNEPIFSKPS
mgnify:FL=1